MIAYIEDPRRAPRIPLQLRADLTFGSATWTGLTLDIGRGGCLVAGGRPVSTGDRLVVGLRGEKINVRLSTAATVAWAAGRSCGLSFAAGDATAVSPAQWFDALIAKWPELAPRHGVEKVPLAALLSRREGVTLVRPLSREEQRVLPLIGERTPLRGVVLHARLPPREFARALFGLMEKGLVVSDVARPVHSHAVSADTAEARAVLRVGQLFRP